uniref:Uncharacterized protein n=1 Tax=Chenopodium quinoa TaxID=63459 RepID=A0A803KMH6_CHEQI
MNSESGGERNSMEIASPSQENDQSKNFRTLTLLYSNYLWSRFSNSPFIGKLSSFCRQFGRARSRRQKLCLPLPLPSKSVHSSLILTEASRIYDVLEDVFEHLLSNMHNVQKNLQYWQAKAEGSNAQKAYFMMFERGPRALIGETVEFVRNFIAEDSSFQTLCHSASGFISERVSVLDSIRCALAVFLSQVYMAIDKQGEDLVADPQKALPSLLITINGLFSNLENSIAQLHVSLSQIDSFAGENNSYGLVFNRMTEVQPEQSQWTDDEIRGAIDIIYKNLQKLDTYLSLIIARHRKPRKMTRYWIRYTCGAVGLSVCSLWIVRHSRLVGSPDIDNWIREAKESTISFWTEHVEQPLMSIRDELFETFRKRHRGVMDSEEVQLTANSLHRYEKEMVHPLKSAFGGELPRAMLIQVQKLKLDIETAMLELNQILKANEINFAILAALPAFALILLSIMLVRSWVTQDKGAEGRGRLARRQRRLLIVEIEKKIMHYQSCMELGQFSFQSFHPCINQDVASMYGLPGKAGSTDGIAHNGRSYHELCLPGVQGSLPAFVDREENCLRQDIIDLAKPDLQTTHKLTITSRMERVYDCLLPSLK